MRLSRHCYDKMRRCPGWAGGGWTYSDVSRCASGMLVINYDRPQWVIMCQFHRCNTCDVVAIPHVLRWLDYTYLWWKLRRYGSRIHESWVYRDDPDSRWEWAPDWIRWRLRRRRRTRWQRDQGK